MNIKEKCSSNKGFTTSEIIISIIILVLFVSIITGSFYNYYVSVQRNTRRTIATNCIIDIIENIEMMNYDDVTKNSIDNLVSKLAEDGTIPNGYTTNVTIQNYNEMPGNEDKKDIIKIVNVRVSYSVNKKDEKLEISRLIVKKGENNEL